MLLCCGFPPARERQWGFARILALGRYLAVLFTLCAAASLSAHDIPADGCLNIFFKPEGKTLKLLVRTPMSAMTEIDFPKSGPGYLVVSKADTALRHATKRWLIDNFEIYENGTLLPVPTIVHARVALPSDTSFTAYESALANLKHLPLTDTLDLYWNQQLLDMLLDYPIQSDRSQFAIPPRVDRLVLSLGRLPRCAFYRRASKRARSSFTVIRGVWNSIRAAIRRHGVLWYRASGTFSKVRIICFSYCA